MGHWNWIWGVLVTDKSCASTYITCLASRHLFYEDRFCDIPNSLYLSKSDQDISGSRCNSTYKLQNLRHHGHHGLGDDGHDVADQVVGRGLAVACALARQVLHVQGVIVLAGVIHIPHGLGGDLLDHPHGAIAAGLAQDLCDVNIDAGGALAVSADLQDNMENKKISNGVVPSCTRQAEKLWYELQKKTNQTKYLSEAIRGRTLALTSTSSWQVRSDL